MRHHESAVPEAVRVVHRFLDQELSADERVRFLVRLGRDDTLRQQLIELEQLARDAARLPRPPVPPGFVERVMERTAEPAAGRPSIAKADRETRLPTWLGLARAWWAPRSLQWNLAGAAAVACVMLAVGAAFVAGRLSAPGVPGDVASSAAAPQPLVLVRLVVLQPEATTVAAAGDFNGWDPARTPLEQLAGGAWAVTIPLEPGRYEYMFVVDGQQWIGDPFAVEEADDGFGSRNAVLNVTPPAGSVL